MIVFPDFYKGGYLDAEKTVTYYMQPLLDLCTPSPRAVSWMPRDATKLVGDDGEPLVRYRRLFGQAADLYKESVHVQQIVTASNRADAMQVSEFCRQMLTAVRNSYEVTYPMSDQSEPGRAAVIVCVEDAQGPEVDIPVDFDERIVVSTFLVTIRRPTLPNYQQVVATL
ncbi:phage tail termination protein [Tsukamurella soli]|uniref:Uncharacterized protein n=1 Tax=Tsukamurella soli TaxID=644556 RepID=A0ABP8K2G4_9ACTN